jgi:hypothetical protein
VFVLAHERNHNSVRSGVYKRIPNFEGNVQHKIHSAHHDVRFIFFLLNLKFCGFITNKCTIYIFSAIENSHLFHFFVEFVNIFIVLTTWIKIRFQQNLQSYRHLLLYPSFNFPFESELFITYALNNYSSAEISHSCGYHTFSKKKNKLEFLTQTI